MADASTIARPYAKAVFEVAMADGRLGEWGEFLQGLASVLGDEGVTALLNDPAFGGEKLAAIIIGALEGRIDQEGQNFIRLLATYDRLDVLPEINARYEALRAEAERTIDVEVTAAAPLAEEHERQLVASLRERLGRDVRLHVKIDEALIGGAIIRAGDLVIDGSLRGRLDELATAVKV